MSQAVTEQEGEEEQRMLVARAKRVKEAVPEGLWPLGGTWGLAVRKGAEAAEEGFWSRPGLLSLAGVLLQDVWDLAARVPPGCLGT